MRELSGPLLELLKGKYKYNKTVVARHCNKFLSLHYDKLTVVSVFLATCYKSFEIGNKRLCTYRKLCKVILND